jgi:hypothetical protein
VAGALAAAHRPTPSIAADIAASGRTKNPVMSCLCLDVESG